jgi:iron complex outermembrane receptor protein
MKADQSAVCRHRTHLIRHLLAGVAGAVLVPGAALAQQNTPAPAATTPPATPTTQAAPAADQANAIADIIVTANRRQQQNQDVPIQISAFSADRLQQQGITKEQDLGASVPSLVVGPNGQGSREAQSFTIRGQGATFQASPGVVEYLNEVPLPSALTLSQQGGPGNFVDLENLQVLEGPQGTLFGRNTTGGAVLLVPKKPTNDFAGWLQGSIGNYNSRVVEGAINVPIIPDKLMIRAVGAFHDRDGYTHDVQWNKDRDNEHWYSGRIGITFRPTDTIDNYTMLYGANSRNNGAGLIHRGFNIDALKGLGFCYDGPTIPGQIASCNVYNAATAQANALGPRADALSIDEFQQTRTWGVDNTTKIDLSDEISLRNIVSYQRLRIRYRYDGDATVLQQHDVDPGVLPGPGEAVLPGDGTPITYTNATLANELPRDNLKQWTEELQLQGDMLDHKLNWTIGGFYYDERPAGPQGSQVVIYCPAAFTGYCAPASQQEGVTSTSKALYAQATLDFGAVSPSLDGLRLTGGYRYTWDHISGYSIQINPTTTPGTVACAADNTPVPVADAEKDCYFSASLHTSAPSWLVGLDYKVAPHVMVYSKVSHSYKAGGFNPYAVFTNTRTFLPEKVTSYEIGLKSDFHLGTVPFRFNTSLYTLNYDNIQRSTGDYNPATNAGGARTLNADARIRGVEVEASIQPWRGLEIGGNFSYTDAKYTKYQFTSNTGQLACNGLVAAGGTADSSCLPFQYVSPYIWSIHASAEQPVGEDMGTLSFFVNYAHTSSQYTEAVQLPSVQPGAWLAPHGTLNASLDWRDVAGSNFDIGLFGTNLTNKSYRISNTDVYQAGAILYWTTLYGEPRMYGLRLKYHFGGE